MAKLLVFGCNKLSDLLISAASSSLCGSSFVMFISLDGVWFMLAFPTRDNKKAAPPRATLTLVALGSPAVLERIRSGSATFCPYLTAGLVLAIFPD